MDDLWSLGITLIKLIFISHEMTTTGEYFFDKFPHDENVFPTKNVYEEIKKTKEYYDNYDANIFVPITNAYIKIMDAKKYYDTYDANIFVPTKKAYEQIKKTKHYYGHYNANFLVPTEKAYEEIQTTTLPNFTTGFSPECVNFLKRIFETVSIENDKVILRDSYFTLSAKDLLEDSWLKSTGGKRRTKRKNKTTAKHKRRKSKNKRKRSSKKH